jgi:CDP-2,3-bis-(O-geranylgeranyl)-sn-glycerol synthase
LPPFRQREEINPLSFAYEVFQVLYFFLPAYLANMSPVLIRGRFEALASPIDGGRTLWGKRILGDHKTWRGLLAGIVAGALVFELQRLVYEAGIAQGLVLIDYSAHPLIPGLLMGLGAGIGDAVKSFFKRRIGIEPGESWPVFDQLDFFLGAYVFVSLVYAPPLLLTIASLPIILFGNIASNAIGYWLGFKETWI